MTIQKLDSIIYSGCIGSSKGGVIYNAPPTNANIIYNPNTHNPNAMVPHTDNNYLLTVKNIFFQVMAQCILICLAPGVTRDKIHVGVNTLTKLYKLIYYARIRRESNNRNNC